MCQRNLVCVSVSDDKQSIYRANACAGIIITSVYSTAVKEKMSGGIFMRSFGVSMIKPSSRKF